MFTRVQYTHQQQQQQEKEGEGRKKVKFFRWKMLDCRTNSSTFHLFLQHLQIAYLSSITWIARYFYFLTRVASEQKIFAPQWPHSCGDAREKPFELFATGNFFRVEDEWKLAKHFFSCTQQKSWCTIFHRQNAESIFIKMLARESLVRGKINEFQSNLDEKLNEFSDQVYLLAKDFRPRFDARDKNVAIEHAAV